MPDEKRPEEEAHLLPLKVMPEITKKKKHAHVKKKGSFSKGGKKKPFYKSVAKKGNGKK